MVYMTGESVLATPVKMEAARLRASLADVPMVFYRPRGVCAWCNQRLAWGGVFFTVLESVSWDLRRLRPLLPHQRPRPH